MARNGIENAIITIFEMRKWNIVTKEKYEQYYREGAPIGELQRFVNKSIGNDIENFLESMEVRIY